MLNYFNSSGQFLLSTTFHLRICVHIFFTTATLIHLPGSRFFIYPSRHMKLPNRAFFHTELESYASARLLLLLFYMNIHKRYFSLKKQSFFFSCYPIRKKSSHARARSISKMCACIPFISLTIHVLSFLKFFLVCTLKIFVGLFGSLDIFFILAAVIGREKK